MKRLAVTIILACSTAALAQSVPGRLTFSAKLANAGVPLTGAHDFKFALYAAATGGVALWAEPAGAQVSLTVNAGLLSYELGTSVALTPAILDGRALYLDVTVDGTALSPRLPIVSVPYAIRADTAGRLGTLAPADVALSTHAHTGTYLPVGTALTCSGSNVVTGIQASTGDVICIPVSGDTTPDTIGDDGVVSDAELDDAITVSAAGNVAWSSLASYPGACIAGEAVTSIGDTLTCNAFVTPAQQSTYLNTAANYGGCGSYTVLSCAGFPSLTPGPACDQVPVGGICRVPSATPVCGLSGGICGDGSTWFLKLTP